MANLLEGGLLSNTCCFGLFFVKLEVAAGFFKMMIVKVVVLLRGFEAFSVFLQRTLIFSPSVKVLWIDCFSQME